MRRPKPRPPVQEEAWAVFPMTRLRPEQVAGALFQAASITTLGPQSHWVIRLISYTGRNDFVRRYGDTGEDEFDARGGTIPQRLLLMNGEIVREKIKDGFFNATTRIAELAPGDRQAVETAYLAVFTRRPTPRGVVVLRGKARRHQGPGTEGPADGPLLVAAEHDGILLEPLRTVLLDHDASGSPRSGLPEDQPECHNEEAAT